MRHNLLENNLYQIQKDNDLFRTKAEKLDNAIKFAILDNIDRLEEIEIIKNSINRLNDSFNNGSDDNKNIAEELVRLLVKYIDLLDDSADKNKEMQKYISIRLKDFEKSIKTAYI